MASSFLNISLEWKYIISNLNLLMERQAAMTTYHGVSEENLIMYTQ